MIGKAGFEDRIVRLSEFCAERSGFGRCCPRPGPLPCAYDYSQDIYEM